MVDVILTLLIVVDTGAVGVKNMGFLVVLRVKELNLGGY